MGRKVGISANAILSFIAPDDEAIGATDPEAYNKYVETANTSFLELRDRPVRYYVKVLNSRAWQKMVDVFKLLGDMGKDNELLELDPERVEDADMNIRALFAEIIDLCLVGCDEHPHVNGVNDDGSFDITQFTWVVGTRRPDGLLESILLDQVLMTHIINFLIRVSTLKETEKNR